MKVQRHQNKTIERIKESLEEIYFPKSQIGLREKDKVNIYILEMKGRPH
jgi:hypothetical protein